VRALQPRGPLCSALLLCTGHLLGTALLLGTAAIPALAGDESEVLLATTTSVRDSGLLDALLPLFSEQTGIEVRTVAVGSGAALRMGADGNADLLLTHAPSGEQELVAKGAAAERLPFMENHFVIAGPAEDPAGIGQAATAAEAMRRIADSGAAFVSRGDDSGTHRKERALFDAAGVGADPSWPNLAKTGAGMGITLQVAGERRAYVLSDLGTFLAFRERIDLEPLSKPTDDLRNVYSLLPIRADRFDGRIHSAPASRLVEFMLSAETQRRIAAFGRDRFGRPLFVPISVPGSQGSHPSQGSLPSSGARAHIEP
jgi:tungstate transport system substrate-binding protein